MFCLVVMKSYWFFKHFETDDDVSEMEIKAIQKYNEIINFHKKKLNHKWPRVLCGLWLLKGQMNMEKYVINDRNLVPQM